jgi:glycosyltransferase involved in cell wall biosynthesis
MFDAETRGLFAGTNRQSQPTPFHIVVGITHPQTCLVLTGRLRALREAGFRVTLVSGPGKLLDQTSLSEGVETIAIPMNRTISPFADAVSLVRLWRTLRRIKPDLTEFSTPKAGLLGTVAAWLSGVPVRVYVLRGLKLETTTGFKRRLLLTMERLASACAHAVVCNSDSLRAEALALGIAPAGKFRLLGGGSSRGVDVGWFSPGTSEIRSRLGISQCVPVVGFVGRLTRDKGLPELVEAFDDILAKEPEAHLLLVGWFDAAEDALDEKLRARILSHPRIHYTGLVPDTAPYYRAMDVMLEAAATGIPVVTTLSTGSRDAVVPEVTGLLIPPGYPEALSEAILKLIRNPERCREMGRAARAWVIKHYVEDRVVGLTASFYQRLLDSAPSMNLAMRTDEAIAKESAVG